MGAVPAGTVPTSPPPNYGAVVFDGLRTILPASVPPGPGQKAVYIANLQTPHALGTYTLKWDMVQEGVAFFRDKGVATFDQTVIVR